MALRLHCAKFQPAFGCLLQPQTCVCDPHYPNISAGDLTILDAIMRALDPFLVVQFPSFFSLNDSSPYSSFFCRFFHVLFKAVGGLKPALAPQILIEVLKTKH